LTALANGARPTAFKFHSSKLLRCLADLDMTDVVDSGNAFAEQLGQWIHFADAITLSGVHGGSIASTATAQAGMPPAVNTVLKIEFDRVQSGLVHSIVKSCTTNSGNTHIALPTPALELPLDIGKAYVPYRRFYEAHQRDMEMSIQPLRVNVRHALAKAAPRLRKLAELDAALEKMLRERESKLLARVPVLLKKRFELLFKEHQQRLLAAQQEDNPAAWMKAGGWLARFCHDMQMLLLAEMELRLQPTIGLIEASNEETTHTTQ
jgi:hypothetical protein